MNMLYRGAVIISLTLVGCASAPPAPQAIDPLSLDKRHFYSTVTIDDDAFATAARFDTDKGHKPARGAFSEDETDAFVRAVVDKKSGHTGFLLYQLITYRDYQWHFYNGASYLGPDGQPVNARFSQIHRDVNCRGGRGTGCFYREHVAFEMPHELMREIAARYDAGDRGPFRYKFTSRHASHSLEGSLAHAEIAGLWERVRDYRQGLGLPPL